jgi:hypothetical protein
MSEQELRIQALEGDILAMMGVVGEVFRRLAQIDAQHEAAVRAGLDGAIGVLSRVLDSTADADMQNTLDYAVKSIEWLALTALAPTAGGKPHGTVQ